MASGKPLKGGGGGFTKINPFSSKAIVGSFRGSLHS